MTGTERLLQYCEDVEHNRIVTNVWIKKAVKRFRQDIERSKTDDFPYWYDTEAADRFVKFCELLKLYQDEFAGKPLHLEPWQCFVMCQTMGWKNKETGARRFNTVFCFVGRKNGKSVMASTLLIYDVLCTNGGQALCCATKREQSKIVYDSAKNMITQNDILSKRLRIYESTSRMVNQKINSRIEAMSSESKKFDGLSPSLIVADELSAMDDYSIIKILKSGQGARKDRLCFQITSGSDNLGSCGKSEFDRSCKILDGIIQDENYLAILYCIDEGDSWQDQSKWIKANPCLGISLKEDFLITACREATQVPSLQTEFRCKNCCEWLSNEHSWIPDSKWTKCIRHDKPDFTKPYYANLSIDLSKSNDLTSLTRCVYQDDKFFMTHWLYFPLDSFGDRIKTETEQWRQWLDKGIVFGTPGQTIDYDWLLKQIEDVSEECEISEILYDPYSSSKITTDLENSFTIVPISQTLKNLSPYTKSYEKLLLDGKIIDPNPFMRWAMSNAKIITDVNDNIKVVKNERKGKDTNRLHIDPVITSLMSVGRIQSLLDNGEIDLRTPEQVKEDTKNFLSNLKF